MKHRLLTLLLFALSLTATAQQYIQPKREFRGAWIQAVNGQFQGLGRNRMQQNLTHQLDELQKCGVNTILFQVRVEADALYPSLYEPWSRFLTGKQGEAPQPLWDPLEWMIQECHKRGMELHAWVNPYRAKTKGTTELAENHPARRNPERFFQYDGLLLFDPGIQENRDYICTIARDIVNRYDVDGFHIDDYFYPYPAAGQQIPDGQTFRERHNGFIDIADWRRYNVNLLIRQLYQTIHELKPWVKFGVSPFGIYHNAKNDPIPGSATNGLQNYDDLYADVLYWIEQGWVDYCVPQIYWEIGHKAADYTTLVNWWSKYAAKRPLVIGQDVERTVKAADPEKPSRNQMPAKFNLQRALPGISGSCLWYSAAVARNEGNFATALKKRYHQYPALQPAMPFISDTSPKKVKKLKAVRMDDGLYLFWTEPKHTGWADKATQYVIYRFEQNEPINTDDPSKIYAITSQNFCQLPNMESNTRHTFVVTALNRIQNESKIAKKRLKL